MAQNFLEELAAEWYSYQGYFLVRNRRVGKRERGGYECELDLIAYKHSAKHLVHIEASTGSGSWSDLEASYQKKFAAGKKYIPTLAESHGFGTLPPVEQIALLLYGSKKNRRTLAGGKIVLVEELLKEILDELAKHDFTSKAVPEHLPLLRGFQLIAQHRNVLFEQLKGKGVP
ncbi:MAG: hypothetical protein N3B01_11350 [Verrucomicrobiae bacterium]|nr:hypothetical protein [Verrucomicrobiae bacterium]